MFFTPIHAEVHTYAGMSYGIVTPPVLTMWSNHGHGRHPSHEKVDAWERTIQCLGTLVGMADVWIKPMAWVKAKAGLSSVDSDDALGFHSPPYRCLR
jgi:hypothetical protein